MKRGTIVVAGFAALALFAHPVAAQVPGPQGRPAAPGGRQKAGPAFRPGLRPLMAALDADSDGELSAAEIAASAQALAKLDKNGDGKLSGQELHPRPAGHGGISRPGRRGPGMRPAAGAAELSFHSSTLPKDDAEKRILAVLDELDRNRRGMFNVPVEDGRLLRLLAETIGAKHVVEIGTSNGYSALWFCLALRRTGGKLTTHEINPQRAALARENFRRAGVEDLVTLVEGDAHQQVAKITPPIDLLFLDADKQGYVDYLHKLLPLVRPGGLVVAHNMNPRQADPRYVKAITTNPHLETLFLHMQGTGVGVSMKKR